MNDYSSINCPRNLSILLLTVLHCKSFFILVPLRILSQLYNRNCLMGLYKPALSVSWAPNCFASKDESKSEAESASVHRSEKILQSAVFLHYTRQPVPQILQCIKGTHHSWSPCCIKDFVWIWCSELKISLLLDH